MKWSASLLYTLALGYCVVFPASASFSQERSATDQKHTQWIADVMLEIQTVKPGMTRGDLKKVFVEEGGVSFRAQRKYVYKSCPYIKVDVTLAPTDEDKFTEKPEDKIVSISRPYLEGAIVD